MRQLRFSIFLFGLLAALQTSRAQLVIDVTWEGGVGNFSDRNWRTTLSLISLVGIDFNLRVDGGKATNSIVNVTTSPTIRDLSVSAGDTLNIANGQSLTLSPVGGNGNVYNNGTISLSSTFNTTDLMISGGTVTFAGSGAVTLGNHPNNRLLGAAATDHLVNASGHTIQGSGQLGADLLKITNAGFIVANQSTDLIIDPSSGGLFNTNGVLRATNGATLILRNGTFNNTGGLIESQEASHVDFDAAAITGGTLISNSTGHFHASNLTSFANVTLSSGSNVEVPNGHQLLLTGTLTNQGTVSLLSSANATDLVLAPGGVTLDGFGTLALSNNANNRVLGNATLTNASAHTIRGSGQLGAGQIALTNHGNIVADQATPLTIDVAPTASIENHGLLHATNGASLVVTDHTINHGLVLVETASTFHAAGGFTQTTGATVLDGGTFTASSATFSGGVLFGSGTINGPVTSGGIVAPGTTSSGTAGSGLLTFNQSLVLTPSSLLHFEISSLTSVDRIQAQSVALDGSLVITFAHGFTDTLLPTTTFTLLTTTGTLGLSGTFTGLANGARFFTADGAGSFQVNYFNNALTISAFQPIPEPSTYALLGLGALAVLALGRHRRR